MERVTCLIPNFIEDRCYDVYDEDLFDFELVDCTGADLRVTTAAVATWIDCAGDEELWAFARAERSYCLDWS
ncbi:hypothetical protein G7085_02650 [Tessaracoccus sp. HDW20]|uniref:hypothetical protein n=1 Tax=Tessaracoccus coleopterorum TaxID=2714950 RepID=UPI0018D30388|nr:hypothetical protein [Tessaracoccus coleopterorum]NHB83937.1 hypothetical protein [Tessaracoccus coleopterorum]